MDRNRNSVLGREPAWPGRARVKRVGGSSPGLNPTAGVSLTRGSVAPEDAPVPAPRPLLRVRDLRVGFLRERSWFGRSRETVRAVDGVDLDIAEGTTLGLVGESGSGKTTLGRALLQLIEPQSGSVVFDGVDVLNASRSELRRLRREMQIVFQDPFGSLNPRMTVGRIVAEPLVIHGVAAGRALQQRIGELLERVGLRADHARRYPHEFSGGQRQRIGIARAIAIGPRFLVLDEPVSALDVSIQAQIINLLDDLRRELSLTCLFIAHNLAVVKHISDRVAVMYLGRIVETAAAKELYAHPRHPYTHALLAAAPNPDPTVRRERPAWVGEPPSPFAPPTGCPFHPRCPLVADRCRVERPELKTPLNGPPDHLVACHLAGEFAAADTFAQKSLALGDRTS